MRWRLYHKINLLVIGMLLLTCLGIYSFLNNYLQNHPELTVIDASLPKDLKDFIVFIFFVFVMLSLLITRWIIKPIEELTTISKDIAGGNFARRVGLSTHDETQQLAKSVNDIVEQMKTKIDEAVSNKSRLEAVFLSMFDGVMVVDKDQTIILMNQTLRDFLHVIQEPVGRKPLEIIRNFEVQEIVEEVLKLNKPFETKELMVLVPEERTLFIHATSVIRDEKVEGAVLVFHDITELRRLENIRRDFVANVSHELRTPVATIKGYAETLLDGALEDKENARDFVQIIHQDSERLASLVNDLLDLARIESGKIKPNLTQCSVSVIANKVLETLKKRIKEMSITVQNEIDPQLPKVRADEVMLTQVLLNLMDNAVKYNKLWGSIKLTAVEKSGFIEISIQDTGIGIPEEDLPRIFERFYRVDKSHSRQLGGTGLGLSIVKHIVQVHSGEISVESKLKEGSTFHLTFPKA